MSERFDIITTDTETLRDRLLNAVESTINESLYPGDERRIFIEAFAYAFNIAMATANAACKNRLLPFATGKELDALGERVGCTRLSPNPSHTTLRFSLSAPRSESTIIPSGTRVTADSSIYFATDESVSIPAGALFVDVAATSTTGGKKTNGIPVNAIQSFVDDVPFVSGISNLTETKGGDDGEPYPIAIDSNGDDGSGDDRYRARIKLAPSGFSTAGPESAYQYYALSASANVSDVKVTSNQAAGQVDVYVIENGGSLPSDATIAEVSKVLQADDIRPMNDKVVVSAPEQIDYGITLTFYCKQADEANTIKAIDAVVAQYLAWQHDVIGRDINPDKLRSLCLDVVPRLDLIEPSYKSLKKSQIAKFNGISKINHVIISDEA